MKVSSSDGYANKSGTCQTLRFKEVEVSVVGGNREKFITSKGPETICPLMDTSQIGRHYLIKSTSHPKTFGGASESGTYEETKHGIKRHYTECFCMRS